MEASIPLYPLIVVPVGAAIFLFWRRARWHLAVIRSGRPLDRFDRVPERIKALAVFVFGQRRLLQDLGPGLTHAFVFWGFIVLLATTGNYLTNGLVETIVGWPLGGFFWSVIVLFANVFVGLVLASVVYFVIRRTITRPPRLALTRDAFVILGLIFSIVLTEWLGDAFAYVLEPDDPSRTWAVLAGPLSVALEGIGEEAAFIGFGVMGWAHILLVLGFGAYLPYSKHLHIISSEPNVYFRNLEPRGALRKMDLEAEPEEGEELPVFGAKGLKDLTWRHLADGLACTECGRCMEFCPASMTGKTLSPKHLMEGLRDQIASAETALAAAASAQRAWKGGANGGSSRLGGCAVAGPGSGRGGAQPAADRQRDSGGGRVAVHDLRLVRRGLPGADRARRHDRRDPPQRRAGRESLPQGAERRLPQHGERGQSVGPAEVVADGLGQGAGRDSALRGRCHIRPASWITTRAPWRTIHATHPTGDVLDGRILFWVGCAGAFDDRNRKVVRAMAQLLAAGRRAVLGARSAGDLHRRSGAARRKRVPVPDAGRGECRDAVGRPCGARHLDDRGDLPALLQHDPQRVPAVRPHGRPGHPSHPAAGPTGRRWPARALEAHHEAVVAYHDACYLGRYNEVYDEGRRVVESVSGQSVVEMDLHHRKGMCCGAGGARMWMEEHEGTRINHKRVEQALEKAPDEIATACPFCLIMLRDGTTDLDRTDVAVRDVAELLADATGAWKREVASGAEPAAE